MTHETRSRRRPPTGRLLTVVLCILPLGASLAQTTLADTASNSTNQPASVAPGHGAANSIGTGGAYPANALGAPGAYPAPPAFAGPYPSAQQPGFPLDSPSTPGSAFAYPGYRQPPLASPGYSSPARAADGTRRLRRMPERPPELIRDITDQGYRLTIKLSPGQKPADIEVRPYGGGLFIGSARESVTSTEQMHQDGRGYRRGFSFSSARFQRRLRVPPDADLGAMTRSDQEDSVVIVLPRR